MTTEEFRAEPGDPKTMALMRSIAPVIKSAIDNAINAELAPLRKRIEALEARDRSKGTARWAASVTKAKPICRDYACRHEGATLDLTTLPTRRAVVRRFSLHFATPENGNFPMIT